MRVKIILGMLGMVAIVIPVVYVLEHPMLLFIVASIVGIAVMICIIYVVYLITDKIHEKHNSIKSRSLARRAGSERLEHEARMSRMALEREEFRMQLEQHRHQDMMLLEQRRIDLEEQKIKLAAYQAQAVHVKRDQSLIIRDYDGLNTRVAYEGRYQIQEISEEVTQEIGKGALIEAPKINVSAMQLLREGYLDTEDVCLGMADNGEVVMRSWKQLMGILILGMMGGGKTNSVIWILLQLIRKGYRVALVDRHYKSDESTHYGIKDFNVYDTPVGGDPTAAMRVIKHVGREFESRRNSGSKGNYKLLFVVDEFTATMRAYSDKVNEWHDVAVALNGLCEDLNSEGRKFDVYLICIGQVTNASRNGGTEVRDLFHTRIVHAMKKKQAQNLGLTEEKNSISKLDTGEAFLDIDGKDDAFAVKFPHANDQFKQYVLDEFLGVSRAVQKRSTNVIRTLQEQAVNTVEQPNDIDEVRLPELAQKVLDLKHAGVASKIAIIEEVWHVKRGGSDRYKSAVEEYGKLCDMLVEFGLLSSENR